MDLFPVAWEAQGLQVARFKCQVGMRTSRQDVVDIMCGHRLPTALTLTLLAPRCLLQLGRAGSSPGRAIEELVPFASWPIGLDGFVLFALGAATPYDHPASRVRAHGH